MTKQSAVSRDADKFVIRMPDSMRDRIHAIAKGMQSSMNTVIVQGLSSWLDGHEDMRLLLDGLRQLKLNMEADRKALDAQLAEVAALKAQLEAELKKKQ